MSSFLEQYPSLGFSRDLRYQWARSLARREQWQDFLVLYRAHYAESGDTVLDCLSLQAEIETAPTGETIQRARSFWLSAFSQPKECDPAFEYLAEQGYVTPELRRQRIALALPKGQIQLARYLARPLEESDRRGIEQWARMKSDPGALLANPGAFSQADRDRVVYGFRRLSC